MKFPGFISLSSFQTFISLLAARAGSLLNLSEVAKECGITQPTAKDWISILESTYIIYLLRPYYRNHTKKLVKSPKRYFVDTGLLCHLLGIDSGTRLFKAAEGERIFENMVVMEMVKGASLRDKRTSFYFYRTHGGVEVDLLVETGGKLYPFEVKFTKSITPRMASSLKRFLADYPQTKGRLLCLQEERMPIAQNVEVSHWSEGTVYLTRVSDKGFPGGVGETE